MPAWNYAQEHGGDPGDETAADLRTYLDRIPDPKIRQYRREWTDDEVMVWCGDFADDGYLILPASARSVDAAEFRRELEASIAYREAKLRVVTPAW
ncbi:MAG: hypothetical protein R2762_22735 [Bryobacteraceae bacterium]